MSGVRRFVVCAALGLGACAPARPAADPLADTSRNDPNGSSQRGLNPTKVDAPKLEALFSERVDQAIARPAVDRAFDELFTSLADEHTLAAKGDALVEALGKDQQLAARLEAFQESLGNEPAMVALVMRLMSEHPGASSERIGELAGQHVGRQTDSPAFDQAVDFAMDRLMERPLLKAAFDRFGEVVADNPHFQRGITTALHNIDYRPLAERVIAFNGGTEPDSAHTTQILIDHAFTTDRFEALLLDWLHLPETRSELRRLANDVLGAPSFQKRVVALVTRLLSDAEVQQGLRDCFVVLLDKDPEPAAMKERFRAALDTPHMDAILSAFITELMQEPALQAMGSQFLERLTNSQAFATTVQRFMCEW